MDDTTVGSEHIWPRTIAGESCPTPADVLDNFPFGILVACQDGTILSANRRATEMLGAAGAPAAVDGHTCCELFGCGLPDGPFNGVCLSELAQQTGVPTPEVRTDLPHASLVSAVWVTAAPSGDHVIFNLRPGDHGDRRSRTEPHWMTGPHLRVFTLGRTRVESREGPIEGKWLKQRPGELLKFLITKRGRAVHAEEIADALWPHAGPGAVGGVRHFVYCAREKLEPRREKGTQSSFILAPGGGYMLNAANVSVDADEFEAQIAAAHAAIADGDTVRAAGHAERALELYHGDYLEDDPYAEWAFLERERLRHLVSIALRLLARIYLGNDDMEGAVSALRRLAVIDSFDLDVQRELIRLCVRTGHRSEAKRRYATLRQRMLREFGELPDFELADLAQNQATAKRRKSA